MAHKQHCAATALGYILHLPDCFLLELSISNSKHLVHNKDFWLKMCCDGETETDCHTAAVTLDGRIKVALHPGKVHNLIEFAVYLVLGHPHDRAVHVDVLAPGKFGMEACAHLQKRTDTPPGADGTRCGRSDPRQKFQQRTFSSAVFTDDAYDITLLYFKRYIAKRPNVVGCTALGTVVGFTNLEVGILATQHARLPPAVQIVDERPRTDHPQAVQLTDIIEFYGYVTHCFL